MLSYFVCAPENCRAGMLTRNESNSVDGAALFVIESGR